MTVGYVLILIWVAHPHAAASAAIGTAEFNTWDACQKAAALAIEQRPGLKTICVEKGERK